MQLSQRMAAWLFLQGREQSPQGYLGEGPGLSSTFPEMKRRPNKNMAWREFLLIYGWLDLDLGLDKETELK